MLLFLEGYLHFPNILWRQLLYRTSPTFAVSVLMRINVCRESNYVHLTCFFSKHYLTLLQGCKK